MNNVTITHRCGHTTVTSGEDLPIVDSALGSILSMSLCSVCDRESWVETTFENHCKTMASTFPEEGFDASSISDRVNAASLLKLQTLHEVETRGVELSHDLIRAERRGMLSSMERRSLSMQVLSLLISERYRALAMTVSADWWIEHGQEMIDSIRSTKIADLIPKGENDG